MTSNLLKAITMNRCKTWMALLLLVFSAVQAMADQAHSEWTVVQQPDGTSMTVRLCGDEWHHYYISSDGTMVTPDDDGVFRPVVGFSRLLRSPRRTHAVARRMERRHYASMLSNGEERRGLVVMVQFPDRQFSFADSKSQWDAILNEEGYSQHGTPGSVHDYFMDQSRGLFNLKFDVAGPVTLSKSVYYYGQNDDFGDDLYLDQLIAEACEQIKDQVDFRDYDWDGDGVVDQLYILYAGYSENYGGNDKRLIWPHEYWLTAYPDYPEGLKIDGVVIDTYACSGELYGWQSTQQTVLSGLGTFCHEFSHCLGLPDFYADADNLGSWDLMASGEKNAYGWCPAGYSAYERMFCGWLQPEELDEPASVRLMQPLSDGGGAYLVRNVCPVDSVDEFYLLENRQQRGWDASLSGHGLLVFHVDYSQFAWDNNLVNTSRSHQRYRIIAANGTTSRASQYAAYPYLANDSLTDTSSPAARVFNVNVRQRQFMGKPITAISESADGLVSFDFMGGTASGIADVSRLTDERQQTVFDLGGRHVPAVENKKRINKPTKSIHKKLKL